MVERAAENMAGWHATSVEALGHASQWWPGAWAADGDIPPIYLNAIVFGDGLSSSTEQVERLRAVFADRLPGRGLVIVDGGTDRLDLSSLGLEPEAPKPVFWRLPDHVAAPRMEGALEIAEVRDPELLAEFEAVSMAGFNHGGPSLARFAVHAPGVLADERFRLWLGRADGRAVGAAMAYVGDDLLGIYGVTVVEQARRRGYGAALTWQALEVAPGVPAALQPSDMAVGMYQRLGFRPVGSYSAWHRPPR